MSRRSHNGPARQYPRTARLNELLREILADELERLDDDRLQLLTITSVDIEGDLGRAEVFYDSLAGEEGDEEVLEALGEIRWKLQRAIGREARMKRTPELSFAPDPAVRAGARIDELLTVLPEPKATVDPAVYLAGTEGIDPSGDGGSDGVGGVDPAAVDGSGDEGPERVSS
jgi:ribosome-binding factor A